LIHKGSSFRRITRPRSLPCSFGRMHPEKDTDRFTDARAIILGSLFRAPFDDPDIILAVLKATKENDQIVVADTKLPNFRVLHLEDIREALPLIDYITPNEDEANFFGERPVRKH